MIHRYIVVYFMKGATKCTDVCSFEVYYFKLYICDNLNKMESTAIMYKGVRQSI